MDADGSAWAVAGVAVTVAAGLLLAAVLFGRQVVVRWYARRPCAAVASCQKVAKTHTHTRPTAVSRFNRCYARRGVSVGKSFVYQLMCRYRYEIALLARELKHRVPPPMPINRVWGVDLTGKQDATGAVHSVLGVVDHGSRRALCLQALRDKASLTLLRALLTVIERFGLPQAIRTDNEAIFTSRLFRFGLWWLGIRHQQTVPGCPWQNGRIERLFGTLKAKLDRWQVSCFAGLQVSLAEFGFWYNEVRPHQYLGGATPVEAWQGVDPFVSPVKDAHFFSAWDGLLTGFYLRR